MQGKLCGRCLGSQAEAVPFMSTGAQCRSRATEGQQPQPGSNPAAFLFWFAFITLCSFFVLNLYIGVVFFQYGR